MRENSKKWLLGLACALLLTGCNQTEPTQTTVPPTTQAPTETTVPEDSLYLAQSPVETATDGAVKVYETDGSVTGIGMLADRVLICVDGNRLQLLSRDMVVQRERTLAKTLSWADASLVLASGGMAYYEEQNGYVLLDDNLVATAMASIQEKCTCQPVISGDFSTIYYATAEGIKAMDVATGITRPLREEYGTVVRLDGLLLEDSLLYYTRQLEEGEVQTCFVSTADGSIRHNGVFQGQIIGWGATVSGILKMDQPMGQSSWILSGDASGMKILDLEETWDGLLFPGESRVVVQRLEAETLTLSVYDLTTGEQTARVDLPNMGALFAYGAVDGDVIWLCDGASGKFYGWDTSLSAAHGEAMNQVPTLADDVSLDDINSRVAALSETHGVKLSLVAEETRTDGINYSVYPDYRQELYTAALDEIEAVLQKIPGEFWTQMARKTRSRQLQIRLVDRFDPAMALEEASGSYDVMNDEIVIEVELGEDLGAIFCHELWNAMEVRIDTSSSKLDGWSSLNPEGFVYSEGAIDTMYLEFGSNYFVNDYGMTDDREDRAQIFMYAMMEGQEDRFASGPIQAKLRYLCQVIRSVYKLEESLVLPWEQYLLAE